MKNKGINNTGMSYAWFQGFPKDHVWGNTSCTCDKCLDLTIEERQDIHNNYNNKL